MSTTAIRGTLPNAPQPTGTGHKSTRPVPPTGTGQTGQGSATPTPTSPTYTSGSHGIVGQLHDAWRKPLDFSGAPAVRDAGPAASIRGRDVLAGRLEGGLGDLNKRYGDIAGRYRLSGPDDFGDERSSVEGAVWQRAMNLLGPQFDRRRDAMNADLAARGLAPTSEAAQQLTGQFSQQEGRTLNDLSLASVLAGAQEHQRLADLTSRNRQQEMTEASGLFGANRATAGDIEGLNVSNEAENNAAFNRSLAARQQAINETLMKRGQPMSDLASLVSTITPGGIPQMPQYGQYSMQSPDIMGLTGSNYAAGQSAAAARNAGKMGMVGALGGAAIPGLF